MPGTVCNYFYLAVLQSEFFGNIGDNLVRCYIRIEKYFCFALFFDLHPAARIIIIGFSAAKFRGNIRLPRLFMVVIIAVFGIERRDRRQKARNADGVDGNAKEIRLIVLQIFSIDDPKNALLFTLLVALLYPGVSGVGGEDGGQAALLGRLVGQTLQAAV